MIAQAAHNYPNNYPIGLKQSGCFQVMIGAQAMHGRSDARLSRQCIGHASNTSGGSQWWGMQLAVVFMAGLLVPNVRGDVTLECSSQRTCSSMGWSVTRLVQPGYENVCAASICPPESMPFDAAVSACSAAGGRLCTRDELAADAARESGCQFNTKLVWTADVCGTNGVHVTGGSTKYVCLCVSSNYLNLTPQVA